MSTMHLLEKSVSEFKVQFKDAVSIAITERKLVLPMFTLLRSPVDLNVSVKISTRVCMLEKVVVFFNVEQN